MRKTLFSFAARMLSFAFFLTLKKKKSMGHTGKWLGPLVQHGRGTYFMLETKLSAQKSHVLVCM